MVRGDRRGDADDQARPRSRGNTVGTEHRRLGLGIEAHDHNDEIGLGRDRLGRGDDAHAGAGGLLAGGCADVAGRHVEARLAEVAGHRKAHLAEADDADAANGCGHDLAVSLLRAHLATVGEQIDGAAACEFL
jgi:hypothetical protein